MRLYSLSILVFPALEGVFFILGLILLNEDAGLSIVFLLLAGLTLNFSIHIYFHEKVHRSASYPTFYNLIASVFLGLPFDGYRLHHYNHHKYDNGALDLSSTWKIVNGQRRPRSLVSYVLCWPAQLTRFLRGYTSLQLSDSILEKVAPRIRKQKIGLGIFLALLIFIDPIVFVMYLALIYLGWALSALQNYGQHPPIEGQETSSYTNRIYNRLLFNNGLHWEHHKHPSLAWHELRCLYHGERINEPHLIHPFCLFSKRRSHP
ncbi:MAG: fatty acid desaturase [Gammaproteobacteria bacterium]|nr:fatty acid desaturase [Gammaproteobacteria bacterium]